MRFPMEISRPWAPAFVPFGVWASNSYVEIDRDHLRVRMGFWFDEELPLSAFRDVKPSDWPWYGGYGNKIGPKPGGVSVVLSKKGVVALTFDPPQKVRMLFGAIITVKCTELRVAVQEPERFMQAVRDAAASGRGAS